MTNILQRDTTQQSLLDGVEPLPCPFCGGNPSSNIGHHSFVDAKVTCEECSAEGPLEARIEANRKQVLLEAAQWFDDTGYDEGAWPVYELRRMALEPTGVDKGEKE
jgi:hypothetical protein